MNYMELDTPAMLIDREIMMDNIRFMQDYADRNHVALRPHTKTHKIPELALLQEKEGAKGITVAKVARRRSWPPTDLGTSLLPTRLWGHKASADPQAYGAGGESFLRT